MVDKTILSTLAVREAQIVYKDRIEFLIGLKFSDLLALESTKLVKHPTHTFHHLQTPLNHFFPSTKG